MFQAYRPNTDYALKSFNRYSYVKNDPVGATDPSGLDELFPDPDKLLPTPNPNTPNPYEWPDDFWWGGNPYSYEPNPYDGGGFFMTVPTPSINLADILQGLLDDFIRSILSKGTLKQNGPCPTSVFAVYIPEDVKAKTASDWKQAPDNNTVLDADVVGTPRGIVKIPNGCNCTLECNDNWKITCTCIVNREIVGRLAGPIPKVLRPDEEFPDPRPLYPWVHEPDMPRYTRSNDILHSTALFDFYEFN